MLKTGERIGVAGDDGHGDDRDAGAWHQLMNSIAADVWQGNPSGTGEHAVGMDAPSPDAVRSGLGQVSIRPIVIPRRNQGHF